jgi:hypothetical protein
MGLGAGLFLIAVGAILAFAVNVDASGFNVNTIGWILLIVGAVGVALSFVFWGSWGGFPRRETTVDAGPRRRVVDEY